LDNEPIVTIVIPTWRRADLLRVCLESVAAQIEQRFRVVVVSNGGGADVEAVARPFAATHDCRLISLPQNRGFAAGVNAGLHVANTKYVAVLNDDVRLDPEWLLTLTRWLEEHPEAGFCSGTIFSDDGLRVDNLGDAVARGGVAWRLGFGTLSEVPRDESPRRLLAASWTAIVLRADVLKALGNLDEQFISYLEDIDFAVRCVRHKVLGDFVPTARCWHHGGASSTRNPSRVFKLMSRNQRLLLAKDFPEELRHGHQVRKAGWLWLLMAIRQGKFLSWLAGNVSYLRALPETRKNRLHWDSAGRERLNHWLEAGEAAIYADQFGSHRGAPDSYWRWYFASQQRAQGATGSAHKSRQISEPTTRRS
jgi:GT2 family glycosyltransferase